MQVGMLAAQGKYILYTDFDQSVELYELTKFMKIIKNGYDLVIGSRGYQNTVRKDRWLNIFRAEVFATIARIWLVPGIIDINCVFKLYKRAVAQKIFKSLRVSRARTIKFPYMGAIDTEILFLAKKNGFKIAESPVNWERKPYVSHLNPVLEPTLILIDLVLMRWLDLLGKYN